MSDRRRMAATVVTVSGDLDLDTAPALCGALTTALNSHREVVLDLSGVEFMDCAGLGALVQAHNQADRVGARLVLRGADRSVVRLLGLTGLDRRLRVGPGPGACAGAV
ncbi:STAS domain-containing protein [Kitasatospora sp. NBC_01560]|uniref:STAS domain-containing protein n=1 Tax=Kitasatospora sp. NBC_01560 TaxID=2975965 RepID=UPI003862FDC5